MDPAFFPALLALVPARYAMWVALAIVACKIVTVFWKPPAAASRWAVVYRVVSTIALNIGWAVSRFEPGVTGIMVPRGQAPTAKALIDASPDVTRLHVPSVPIVAPTPVTPPAVGPGSRVSVPPPA